MSNDLGVLLLRRVARGELTVQEALAGLDAEELQAADLAEERHREESEATAQSREDRLWGNDE